MTPEDTLLNKELRRDEGVRYMPYVDTVGIQTIGVGHNLKAKPIALTPPLTDAQIDQLLADDLKTVFDGLDSALPWWRNLSYARQRVCCNMAFNLGLAGLLTFKNTLTNVQVGNYEAAADGMLASKWATQTGQRAIRLALMMRNG